MQHGHQIIQRSAPQQSVPHQSAPPSVPAPTTELKLRGSRNMFIDGFLERHDLEQYFWTTKTTQALQRAIGTESDVCCLCVPSLAELYHSQAEEGDPALEMYLLDIDTRFAYLPLFTFFDLRSPRATSLDKCEKFRVIVFDPPFFYISLPVLHAAVMYVCRGDTNTKLLLGFLRREESLLLQTFRDFHLSPTKFQLEYSHVKSNKWVNYCLYSNVDLPGIKRMKGGRARK